MELRKIPKKAYEYAESLFDLKGQLQYKRKGRHLSVYCTACGTRYEGVTELGDTLEQRAMEKLLDTPDKDILQPLLDNYVKGLKGKRYGKTCYSVSAEL